MKALKIITICMTAALLSGCSPDALTSELPKSYDSVIRLQPEDESKLTECGEIAEARLIAEYPGLECKLSYKYRDSFIYIEFDCPDNWDDSSLETICRRGELTFRKGADTEAGSDGQTVPTGEIVLSNTDINSANATLMTDDYGQSYAVAITMSDTGKDKFAAATDELTGTAKPLTIWFDGELISAPTVSTAITNGQAVITGDFTQRSAMELAAAIGSGALPCELKIYESKIGDGSK